MGFISRHRLGGKNHFYSNKLTQLFTHLFFLLNIQKPFNQVSLSMHFGVVDHIRASALTTADRRPPSWIRITDSTYAPPVGNGIGEPHLNMSKLNLEH
jgi:hypothetical protein